MTGFSSVEADITGHKMRLEIKTLNHRYLDVKVRLPRDFSSAELPLRAALQAQFSRGAVELKLDRVTDASSEPARIQANLSIAAEYYEALITLQRALGLNDPIKTTDIALLPDVIAKGTADLVAPEQAWKELEPLARAGMKKLEEMRAHEGAALTRVLLEAISEMETKLKFLREKRQQCETSYKSKIQDKIRSVFEAHPISDSAIKNVLESRLAQELSLLLERTDIEEELVRFQGHLDHFRKVLGTGGTVGRKLDFIIQELGREINTMGNKAQDFSMSEEVVQIKVRLEQMREQVMNLE
jgi:uncharacterized protein (TIGR00255 family)